LSENKKPRTQALLDGFTGIALQSDQTQASKDLGAKLLDSLKSVSIHDLSFDQKLDIIWGACALELESNKLVSSLHDHLMSMNFQRTDNDLTFEQFQKIKDFQLYL
jgi:hypothetical protein